MGLEVNLKCVYSSYAEMFYLTHGVVGGTGIKLVH